ncbi:cytochrome P450 family protein [Abortiporus biennis]
MYRKALTTQRISQLGAIYLISFLLHQFASKMSLLSMLGNYPVISTFTLIALIYYVDKKLRYYLTLPLPPGPKRLPLVGNLFNAPTGNEVYKIYQGWTTQYGSDVLYMKLPNTPIVILNSAKACIDLLEKRSHIYSDRPYSVMDELLGMDYMFALTEYSLQWRRHRKLFHEYFNSVVSPQYASEQVKKTREFLLRSLKPCDNFSDHVRLTLGSSILKVVYGVDVDDMNHPYIQDIHAGIDCINEAHSPNQFWIDFFPMFKKIPKWIPGVSFKRFVEENKSRAEIMRRKPYDDVKKAAETSVVSPSITSTVLGKLQTLSTQVPLEEYIREEEMAINVMGIAYAAGTDTSSASAAGFFIALAHRPDIQRKAQAELDAHLGLSRLIDDSDYNALPYIRAIALEVMRFRPAAPLGVPHRVMEDDEYNGYFIPKGSIVFSNIWAALHDPIDYPDPETFHPERFLKGGKLDPTVRDPSTLAFGFGRRICPGRHFTKDINGDFANFDSIQYAPGIVASPDRVPCVLKVRSEEAKRLILEAGDV